MTNTRNLPNLAKQIKRIIGQMRRENIQYCQRIDSGEYEVARDIRKNLKNNLHALKFVGNYVFITKAVHKKFVSLLDNIQLVFNAEKVEYDIDQISSKVSDFIVGIVASDESYDLNTINDFIEKIKIPDYRVYFFRLFNFEYQEKINLGPNIIIISGREFLKKIPENLNLKAEENPKIKTLVQPEDILLGVSVIDTGKSDKGYYHALNIANNVNNIINFLNGFNHRPSQILELSQHIIQEDGLYQITKKNGHFYNKQTPGILEGDWSASTGIDPDKRPHATMNFDKQWMPIIPLIATESDKLTSLQKQGARAIDWIGDGIVNSNLTKQFLQIMISLETMLEQDPDKLESKLKKEDLWKDTLSTSIEDQLVSTISLICNDSQINLETRNIKRAYDLRSEITHNGEQLTEDDTALIKDWYDIAYKIIANIMFLGNWSSTYDLWKAANLGNKDSDEN